MSNYRSMIDEALHSARARLDSGSGELMKTASAPVGQSYLIKEANELADALEFMAHTSVGTGSAADGIRGEMVRSFFNKSAMGGKSHGGSPPQSETTTSGMQAQAPSSSKKKIAINNASGGSPAQGSATPAPKDGEKAMLESFKQAEGQSLYDILMSNKVAGHGGPHEMTASEDAPGIPSGNENAGRQSMLGSNEAPVSTTKRQAKKTTRARLAEAFAHAGDTTGDAAVRAMFPIGAGKGTHKVASVAERLQKVASQDMATLGGAALGPIGAALGADEGKRLRSFGGSLAGGVGGAGLGALAGAPLGVPGAYTGAVLGGLAGRTLGARMAHGGDMSAKERIMRLQQQAALEEARSTGAF
jgi:hypothetical protein